MNLILLALSLLHSGKLNSTSEIESSIFEPSSEFGDDEIIYLGQTDPIVIWKANQYPPTSPVPR